MKATTLGDLEKLILMAAMSKDKPICAMDIKDIIKERVDKEISVGALYNTLGRLEKRKFINVRLIKVSEGGRSGKKYYQTTKFGITAVFKSIQDLMAMYLIVENYKGETNEENS